MTKCRDWKSRTRLSLSLSLVLYLSISVVRAGLFERRQGYSQSRRSREFPCGAHARRDAALSCFFHLVRFASVLLRGSRARRLPAVRAVRARRRCVTPLLKRTALEARTGPGDAPRRLIVFHQLHCCDIRLFYISLLGE